jgi:O-antigen/teichoic acid export membrane protein
LLLCAGLFAWTGGLDGVRGVIAFWVAATLALGIQRGLFRSGLPAELRRAEPSYALRGWLRVALPLSLAAAFQTVLTQTDVVMIGSLLEPRQVGIYSAAVRTSSLIGLVLVAVNTAGVPQLAALQARGDRQGMQRLLLLMAHGSFWPSLCLAVPMLAIAGPVLGLFGPEFRAAQLEMAILIAGHLINLMFGPTLALAAVAGFQRESARVLGWSALLNVALNAVLVPRLGITGGALATASTTVVWKLWHHRLVTRGLGLRTSLPTALLWSLGRGEPRS